MPFKIGNKLFLGHHHSQESRTKLSIAKTGHPMSAETRAKISASTKGCPKSIETRTRMSAAFKGRIVSDEAKAKNSVAHTGEKHPNWRGGIDKEKYGMGFTRSFKSTIRARDGFTCLICGKGENGQCHDVHHIDYKKRNHNPSNLVTLCRNCHSLTNYSREGWAAYFGAT